MLYILECFACGVTDIQKISMMKYNSANYCELLNNYIQQIIPVLVVLDAIESAVDIVDIGDMVPAVVLDKMT